MVSWMHPEKKAVSRLNSDALVTQLPSNSRNASDTAEQVDEDMENGLGSALRKLYKGCIGESKYAKYKTKRG